MRSPQLLTAALRRLPYSSALNPRARDSRIFAPGVAIGDLAIEQERQPFGVREIAHVLLRFVGCVSIVLSSPQWK